VRACERDYMGLCSVQAGEPSKALLNPLALKFIAYIQTS